MLRGNRRVTHNFSKLMRGKIMKRKIISMLALMFLVASCQPQADDNSSNQQDTDMMDTGRDMMDSKKVKSMDSNGRSNTRARMNQQNQKAGKSNKSSGNNGSCGSCGSCESDCGSCCTDTGCGPCSDNDLYEVSNELVEELGSGQA